MGSIFLKSNKCPWKNVQTHFYFQALLILIGIEFPSLIHSYLKNNISFCGIGGAPSAWWTQLNEVEKENEIKQDNDKDTKKYCNSVKVESEKVKDKTEKEEIAKEYNKWKDNHKKESEHSKEITIMHCWTPFPYNDETFEKKANELLDKLLDCIRLLYFSFMLFICPVFNFISA